MSSEKNPSGTPQVMRNVFGIIMIIVYVGMGVLFLCGAFSWLTGSWAWLRWVGGVLFIVYGIWRAYRQFKGVDPDISDRN